MGDEMRFWGPMVALIAGALAGLGLLRSRQSAFGLAVGLAVIQIIGWVTLSLILWREPGEDWNITLWASFLLALMYVIPYTAIGAAIVGGIIALVRGRGKRKTVCVCVCICVWQHMKARQVPGCTSYMCVLTQKNWNSAEFLGSPYCGKTWFCLSKVGVGKITDPANDLLHPIEPMFLAILGLLTK
jgi:hypothetical protein